MPKVKGLICYRIGFKTHSDFRPTVFLLLTLVYVVSGVLSHDGVSGCVGIASYVFVYAHGGHACALIYRCRGQRLSSPVFLSCFPSLVPSGAHPRARLISNPIGFSCLHLLERGLQTRTAAPSFFMGAVDLSSIPVLIFLQQVLCPLTQLPNLADPHFSIIDHAYHSEVLHDCCKLSE